MNTPLHSYVTKLYSNGMNTPLHSYVTKLYSNGDALAHYHYLMLQLKELPMKPELVLLLQHSIWVSYQLTFITGLS